MQDGYTCIPNVVLQAMARLPKREAAVLLCIIRQTWGFQRSEVKMSCADIAKWLGIDRRQLSPAIHRLADRGLIDLTVKDGYIFTVDEAKMRLAALVIVGGTCG